MLLQIKLINICHIITFVFDSVTAAFIFKAFRLLHSSTFRSLDARLLKSIIC